MSACLLPSFLSEVQEWSTGLHFSLFLLWCGSAFKALKVPLNSEPTWPLEFPFEKGNVEESCCRVICDGLLWTAHHMCSLDCSWPEEAGTTSKVCNLASKEKHLGALLFKGRIKVLFEVHRHRFQAGNYWPSVLISKHDSLPCQPRTKLCHSCDNPSCSLSASTNKWLIYHCNYLQ